MTGAVSRAGTIEDRLLLIGALAGSAGLIHGLAAATHLAQSGQHAAFFAVLAVAQCGWAAAILQAPSRRLLLVGAGVSLAVVLLWTVSRTSGLPLGLGPQGPEPVGLIDTLASADELVLVALVAFRLSHRALGARALIAGRALDGMALWLALASTLALLGPTHTHEPRPHGDAPAAGAARGSPSMGSIGSRDRQPVGWPSGGR